ncbi:adenine phosphoribosyltransferase [Halothermothrix orenii]|uniref:Adenine phosphoribosyltransferase n=1 Tax=Halothermothrix orenii (strain H 168 / OCM 544 / DSM 9562) TaxID=373903 RepID=APT_HALOH|nr:adenine phosphoribosyltransferase [Halothermothrix orenii]B8CXF1.1 RecName: Full=Adenine phosphoribosyltransferase; Short=APRT [Halothermothrix orenii H 168]ACL69970.1 adenine phosphoribosyltransferase [Halothermothrix orenii H 168]
MELKKFIRDIPDFPKKGIIFKDITPLLKDKEAFNLAIEKMKDYYKDFDIDYIVGIEARGFIIGTPLALALNKGFIPIRKPGKLPAERISTSYELEYGTNEIEIHRDAIQPGDKILLVDDLLATGGTVKAAIELINKLQGEIVSLGFLIELVDLKGREKLEGYDVFTLLQE